MILRLFILFVFCCMSFQGISQGQRYLVLDKPGNVKRIRYYAGEELKFKLKDDKTLYTDIIEDVGDSSIKIRGTQIPIKDIRMVIRYKEGGLLNQAIYILPRAGILYFLADTFNPVFRGGSVDVSRSGIIIGSSFVAGGLFLKLFKKKKYRMNTFRRLRTLETF